MLRLVSETPVLEDTILRILMMGIDNEFPIKSSDALKVVELMVNRAASLNSHSKPDVTVQVLFNDVISFEFIHFFISLWLA